MLLGDAVVPYENEINNPTSPPYEDEVDKSVLIHPAVPRLVTMVLYTHKNECPSPVDRCYLPTMWELMNQLPMPGWRVPSVLHRCLSVDDDPHMKMLSLRGSFSLVRQFDFSLLV